MMSPAIIFCNLSGVGGRCDPRGISGNFGITQWPYLPTSLSFSAAVFPLDGSLLPIVESSWWPDIHLTRVDRPCFIGFLFINGEDPECCDLRLQKALPVSILSIGKMLTRSVFYAQGSQCSGYIQRRNGKLIRYGTLLPSG